METVDIWSFASSFMSVVLALIAIWLSVMFYRWTSVLAESTKDAAKGIAASVARLEELFDKLYTDTFSIMKDTVTDMRKHIWPEQSSDKETLSIIAEKKASEKVEKLKTEIGEELGRVLSDQQSTGRKIESLASDVKELVERAIMASSQVQAEAKEEILRQLIIEALSNRKYNIHTAGKLFNFLEARYKEEIEPTEMVDELERMKKEGIITLSGEDIVPETVIELLT